MVRSGTVAIRIWKRLAGVVTRPQLISIKANPIVRTPNSRAPNMARPFGSGIRLKKTITQNKKAARIKREAAVPKGANST